MFNGQQERLEVMLDEMIKRAGHGEVNFIPGRALGKKPKYFIIGDEPGFKDYLTAQPFSGPLNEILTNCFTTLGKKYGTKPDECYTTYLIKCSFSPGKLTEDMVTKEWVPIAQLEYYLSGCTAVAGLGRIARQFVGEIQQPPALLKDYQPSWKQKMHKILKVLRS